MICGGCGAEVSVMANECPSCQRDLRRIGPLKPKIQAGAPVEAQSGGSTIAPDVARLDFADDVPKLVAAVSDAVVTVRVKIRRPEGEAGGSGSGFAVAGGRYVVTNHHVIAEGSTFRVIARNGQVIPARVVAADDQVDLAILGLRSALTTSAPIGDSDTLRPGEFVVVIGNPLGDFPGSVTIGVVSGLRDLGRHGQVLQLDAAISPGSSGSPVFNRRGEVIGVIFGSSSREEAQNLNLAVPSNQVRRLMAGLVGERSDVRPTGEPIWADDGRKQWIPCWNCKGSGVEPGSTGQTCPQCDGEGGIYVDA